MREGERVGAVSELLISMEVPALVAASATTHGGSLSLQPPSSSPSSRKEWSAVSEHRNAGDEVLLSLKKIVALGLVWFLRNFGKRKKKLKFEFSR